METKVGIDRLNVECEDLMLATSESKGESDVGTKGVPKDVGE